MSKSKRMDLLCGVAAVAMVLAALLVLGGGGTLLKAAAADYPYVTKIFDTEKVHTIDIVADSGDWEGMLENAAAEEYISCSLVIDGEAYQNVALRPKGNSSLRTVSSSESDRYSFKIEFDHYDKNTTYYGLDKLCLNNVIQDNTYMKDYLCYRMMNEMGADSPLTSFAWLTVNGEDWGLYTAAEGVEDSFAQRVYGSDHGQIYKPDSMDMGGGGRGAEARNREGETGNAVFQGPADRQAGNTFPGPTDGEAGNTVPDPPAGEAEKAGEGAGFGGKGGIQGSQDVLLVYSDDNPESYPNIFDNAVFDHVDEADENRLIEAIRKMNQGEVETSVNVEEVLRYFAVHNFVLNDDSYTGSIVHNYYLYEEEGILSMIAWDYNLAFGGMGMGGAGADASSAVNSPIDSPVSGGDLADRPMAAWIWGEERYTGQYHQVMEEFISSWFESGYFETLIEETAAMISPYVEKDPTAFCTYEEFQTGVETLKKFCLLRAQSVRGQLDGLIPSTAEGQKEDSGSLIDASGMDLADMGSQGGGRMAGGGMENGMTPPAGDTLPTVPDGEENGNREAENQEKNETFDREIPGFQGGQDIQAPERLPGRSESQEQSGGNPMETGILLGLSVILLLFGLLFARFYS